VATGSSLETVNKEYRKGGKRIPEGALGARIPGEGLTFERPSRRFPHGLEGFPKQVRGSENTGRRKGEYGVADRGLGVKGALQPLSNRHM